MKLRNGFTLAEICLSLLIVSAIIVVTFITTKPTRYMDQKAIKAKYAATIDALNLTVFEIMGDEETNPFVLTTAQRDSGMTNYKKLCDGFKEYINSTIENCSIYALSDNVTYMKDENIDFKTLTPNLVSLSGVKFYISKLIEDDKEPATDRSYYDSTDPNFKLQFFMVYADLNGTEAQNRPHTIVHDPSGKKVPDVYAFAVIPTGDVIPMGLAEYDSKYIATRISYNEDGFVYYSPFYSYRKAKHLAWDYYKSGGSNIIFKKNVSYTHNDFIKEILLRNGSQLYKFNDSAFYPETYADIPLYAKCTPAGGTTLTRYDMCGLKMDMTVVRATH